jgi:hypothetical protein
MCSDLPWIGKCIAPEWGVGRSERCERKVDRGFDLAVHFEKKDAKLALVKPENLRIAFELPIEVV